MVDEASAIDAGLMSPHDCFPFPLNEVDMKSSKDKPASKWVVVEGNIKIKERKLCLPRDTKITIGGNATVNPSCNISSDKIVYKREVLKDNGDENYYMGEVVTIRADSAGPRDIFNKSVISYNSSSFDNPSSPKTTLPMPGNYAKVTTTYKPNIYDLEVWLGARILR